VRFRHLAPNELEIVVMDSETGKPVVVSWPVFSGDWQQQSNLEVLELEDGAWQASRLPVTPARNGLQLARLRPGGTYRVVAPVTVRNAARRS
jgi:hypothetical protein